MILNPILSLATGRNAWRCFNHHWQAHSSRVSPTTQAHVWQPNLSACPICPSLSHLFFRFRALRTGSAGTASSTSSAYLLHRCFPPRMGKMTSDKQEVHNNWKCSLRWIKKNADFPSKVSSVSSLQAQQESKKECCSDGHYFQAKPPRRTPSAWPLWMQSQLNGSPLSNGTNFQTERAGVNNPKYISRNQWKSAKRRKIHRIAILKESRPNTHGHPQTGGWKSPNVTHRQGPNLKNGKASFNTTSKIHR